MKGPDSVSKNRYKKLENYIKYSFIPVEMHKGDKPGCGTESGSSEGDLSSKARRSAVRARSVRSPETIRLKVLLTSLPRTTKYLLGLVLTKIR